MAACCGFGFVMSLIEELTYFVDWGYLLENVTPFLALSLAGLTLLGVAGSPPPEAEKISEVHDHGGQQKCRFPGGPGPFHGLLREKGGKGPGGNAGPWLLGSGLCGRSPAHADSGRASLGDAAAPDPEPEAEAQAEDQATATLKHIRSINDAIANPELSQKIERIEELTAKIFQLLEERPEKAGQLRSFMNYYLPQTLKILENYSKLEAQGIEGENIAEAKQKIEAMMDKVVDGYETQLDKLFADDVLDISADLKVMESMLEKDGLTVDNELKF